MLSELRLALQPRPLTALSPAHVLRSREPAFAAYKPALLSLLPPNTPSSSISPPSDSIITPFDSNLLKNALKMQRCAHCGHYGRRNAHCSPRKKKLRHKSPRPRQRVDRNDWKRGILPTECFIPLGTPRYTHKPFDDTRCIRLLVLLPGNRRDLVRCELVVRPLDNAQYEAISYAWGPEEERGDILCHDQRLRIPWNLEHGLRKFRRLRKKRILWADSVCINQDDTVERGHQVQNMSKVYERARRVLVWLGVHEHSNPSALFGFIRALGPVPPPDDRSVDYVDYQVKVCGQKHWPTFRNFNHMSWFTRLWVMQEIFLASSAVVHYGPASLDWEALADFCGYMAYRLFEVVFGHRLWIVGPINRLMGMEFRNPGQSIHYVLQEGRIKDCSDPRDRVYALLGHKACRDTIANPHSELFLSVNYSISHKDLYTAVAVRALQAEGFSSLNIINLVSHDSISIYDYQISSWVPRWDLYPSLPFVYMPAQSDYAAHGNTTVEAFLNGNCLSVTGFTFDSVAWVSEAFVSEPKSFPGDPSNAPDHVNPHPFVQAWNYIRKTGNTESRKMLEAMLLTFYREGVRDEAQRFVNGAAAYAYAMGLDVSGVEDWVAFEDIPYFQTGLGCSGHLFFLTSRGWIGMGTGVTLPGDDICIFFGAPTPFVARQLPSAGESLYRLCGPCKISGIMQGEAIEMLEAGAFEKITFNLI